MYRLASYHYPRAANLFPALAVRQTFAGLESEIDRLFSTALAEAAAPARFPVDLYEDADHFHVRAELPGVTRDAVNLELVDGFLNLQVQRTEPTTAGTDEPVRTFTLDRSVSLPAAVDPAKVSANLEHGVLTVTLPKQEQAKSRKIAINVN